MATYLELHDILDFEVTGATDLYKEVAVACLVTADLISSAGDDGAPFDQTAGAHDKRVIWAEQAYKKSKTIIDQVFSAVIAANAGASQATILQATDTAIQNNVNAVVDTLAFRF